MKSDVELAKIMADASPPMSLANGDEPAASCDAAGYRSVQLK
jgi:hypothetical protein